jgi:elongation factor Tu
MNYSKNDVLGIATKLGRLVNGGVVGYYVGGKTSEIMSDTLPERILEVVELHKKIVMGTNIAQSFVPGANVIEMPVLVASLWKMYYDINNVLGISISENVGKSLTSGILTNLTSAGAMTIVSEGVKLIPGAGWLVSYAINTAAKTALIYGSAYLYLNALTTMYEAEGKFNEESIETSLAISNNDLPVSEIPFLDVAILGHVDHGKTTLASAISSVLEKDGLTQKYSYDELNDTSIEYINGASYHYSRINYKTEYRHYSLVDFPNHSDVIKAMVTGTVKPDGAILVVSAADGPMPQTREHVLIARQLNIPNLVVFLNKCDLADDDDMLDLVEMEIQEILSQYEYDEDTPIIRGSALGALNGVEEWESTVEELLETCNDWFDDPDLESDKPFLMPIDDVFTISGRGTVVTGRISSGIIRTDNEVEILGLGRSYWAKVTGVEMFNKVLDEAQKGDHVGMILSDVSKDVIKRGMFVCSAGVFDQKTTFKATIYANKPQEGGRSTPFGNHYRPQFIIGNWDITGEIFLPEGVEMVMPGDNVEIIVTLIKPIVLTEGQQFFISERGNVGSGVITEVLE